MERVDHLLSLLSYSRRIIMQLTKFGNLRYSHLIFKGFTPDRGYYYDFDKYGYKSYVTDVSRYLKTTFINYHNRNMMTDKYACYLLLKQFTDKTTPIYGLVDNGELYLLNNFSSESELFAATNKMILKPRKGRGGEGVKLVEIIDGKIVSGGQQVSAFRDVYKEMKDYVLNPYVQQHDYAATIYPQSLNSIRLLSCIQDGKARIIRAGHRFGVKGTGCVDNFSSGGLFAIIDLNTGVIESATSWDNKARAKKSIQVHPDTGEQIVGVQIPNWHDMLNEMIKLHESMKFIKYVGWDVAVTQSDFRIIEANYASDLVGLQLNTPLLLNEENRKFFSMYG